ncbi:PaaI family thioesterase [Salipiger sp.]|uniref:PaaI family thioesterase n=1 Tax=Salipiger sp. TaxID=2078585 RepID=UPI003A971FAF
MTDGLETPSNFARHLGYELVEWREDYARYEMPITEALGNRGGIPHGGVHATLLDSAMGISGCWTGDPEVRKTALTLSLNVQYIGRPVGTRLICEGVRTGGGRSTFFAEAVLRDDTGALVAKGTGVFRQRTS